MIFTEIKTYCGDCLEILPAISNRSIDFIFTDLPFGTTHNHWDIPIDLDALWTQYLRVIKDNGCIALWAQAPYDKILTCSQLDLFRYEWIVEKTKGTGFLNAKKMPLKTHENVLVFYKHLPVYNPQKTTGHKPVNSYTKHTTDGECYGKTSLGISGGGNTDRYPRDVLKFKWDTQKTSLHSTQKPVAACEYFIKTYTNPGDTVLDSCMGSGTTGVACLNTGRRFIGIEQDETIFRIAENRLSEVSK